MNITKIEAESILTQMKRGRLEEGYVVLAFNQPFLFKERPSVKNSHVTKEELLNILNN